MENNNDMQLKKAILLKTLKAFTAFCEEHQLTYFAAYGTCLGAIRHKGFIPWDDDIDVVMPREDYDKLISLRSLLNGTGYELNTLGDRSKEKGVYFLPFSKFCDANTTIWEHKALPCIFGAFVDVFPLDEVQNEIQSKDLIIKFNKSFGHYMSSVKKWTIKEAIKFIKEGHLRAFASLILSITIRRNNIPHYLQLVLDVENQIKGIKGGLYCDYLGLYPFEKETVPKSYFGNGLKVKFEDTTIVVPEQYDNYLKHFYNDWHQLPPKDQREPHHTIFFQDLSMRWNIKDIKVEGLKESQLTNYEFD